VASAAATLAAAGVASPRYDAEVLAAHVLGVVRGALPLAEQLDAVAYEDLVAERARRVPLQHLVGTAAFRHLTLAVGPGVFVPRPETEVVVDAALAALAAGREPGPRPEPVVVDLGTGSGAIALALASECPGSVVHAVEVDPLAAAWAQRNLDAHPALDVRLHLGDLATALPELDGGVDLVVSNPPYIPDGASVEREVAEHDPGLALWGGPDGLRVVRDVLTTARRLLRPGGALVMEHADAQGSSVPALVSSFGGFLDVADHPDLSGRARYVCARRESR